MCWHIGVRANQPIAAHYKNSACVFFGRLCSSAR